MAPPLPDALAAQLDGLRLDPGRPLLVVDADEVLLQFVRGLEGWLPTQGALLALDSFALTGNIRDRGSGAPLEPEAVKRLLSRFFLEESAGLPAVPGAPEALSALSALANVVVLSNVPEAAREARRTALRAQGMDYPLIVNIGAKGAAVRALAGLVRGPTVFMDDIPQHIASVARSGAEVWCIHFVGDPRLARLVAPAAECHARIDSWPEARHYIAGRFDSART